MRKLLLVISLSVTLTTASIHTAEAQTRFYLPSTGTAPISPAFGTTNSTWSVTTNAVRRNMSTTTSGTGSASITSGTAISFDQAIVAQYISAPLAAQTILASSAFKFQIRGNVSTGTGGYVGILLKVVDATGTTVRGTLINDIAAATTALTTSLKNSGTVSTSYTFTMYQTSPTNVTTTAGDRLVLEIGGLNTGAAKTFTINFGDNSTDLPQDNTTTTALNPWFESGQTITFQSVTATNKGMPLGILMN